MRHGRAGLAACEVLFSLELAYSHWTFALDLPDLIFRILSPPLVPPKPPMRKLFKFFVNVSIFYFISSLRRSRFSADSLLSSDIVSNKHILPIFLSFCCFSDAPFTLSKFDFSTKNDWGVRGRNKNKARETMCVCVCVRLSDHLGPHIFLSSLSRIISSSIHWIHPGPPIFELVMMVWSVYWSVCI